MAALVLSSFLLVPLSSVAQRPVRPIRKSGAQARRANVIPEALRRAIQSSDTIRFTGRRTVTVLKDGQPDRHEEIVMRDGPQLRIEFPREGSYAGQVIVEDGSERRHYIPRTNEVRILPTRREEGLQRLRLLSRAGGVTTEKDDRVAGYAATVLVVRDAAGNPLQRLAIEPESGMVLSRQVYDATGVQVGGYTFTKLDLSPGPFDPSLFRIERKGVRTSTPEDELQRKARQGGYPAVGLGESTGYRLDSVNLNRKMTPSGVLVQNYSGPGGRLSLFALRAAIDPASLRRQGGKRLRSLSWVDGGVTYVLLGPQDDATLTRLRSQVGPVR